MTNLTITNSPNLTPDHLSRLNAIAQVTHAADIQTDAQFLEATKDADIIVSNGSFLYQNLNNLSNVLVTYPYTELGPFNSKELAQKGVYVANARGGNMMSMVEWTLFMAISLFRQTPTFLRTTTQHDFTPTESLEGKQVLIVGSGTIGTEVGKRCEAFGMNVDYFKRGDDLSAKSKDADLVINTLNSNESSKNLLNAHFFANMKQGSYYVTFVRPYTYDIDGLIAALDNGTIAGAAIDCDPEAPFDITNDFYKKCLTNEKILVTPHVAFATTQGSKNGTEIMVKNVEMYIAGTPQNIVEK